MHTKYRKMNFAAKFANILPIYPKYSIIGYLAKLASNPDYICHKEKYFVFQNWQYFVTEFGAILIIFSLILNY